MNKTLKINQRIILFVLIVIFFNQNLFSQPDVLNGDLGIFGKFGYRISATMEVVSAPFEGITAPKVNYIPYNRVEQIQNGASWRFFNTDNTVITRQIAYVTGFKEGNEPTVDESAFLDFGHCSGEEYPQYNINVTWGFAKYKIAITAQQMSSPQNICTFKFYLNSLDSKFQESLNQGGYRADLKIKFEPINEENIPRIRFYKMNPGEQTIGYIYTSDILNGEPTKEYKVWEVVPQTPVNPTKNFFAKTTPFPICPRMINSHKIRVLELGTEVTLNGVYPYTGEDDRNGYNTIDSLNAWSYNYYSNPPIITGENVTGKTYVTPATFYEEGTDNLVFGFRLNVKPDNKITIINDHRLWISGYNNSGTYKGDTICFSPGSQLDMESYSQLNACRGGKIIDSNAAITWNPNAFMRICEFSEIVFSLNNNVVNNGGHIEVETNGKFKVCDNSTVTFDGAGTYLKLNPNSIVQLGENAKIEFKNGAYLIANGSVISSLNPSTPGKGLVFENAGEQTSITWCTFTNLKKPVYIENTTPEYAGKTKVISNNIFNNTGIFENYVIHTVNANNITISYNQILMKPLNGIGLLMYYSLINEEEESSSESNINIHHNNIQSGQASVAIVGMTSYFPIVNFFNNTCSGTVGKTSLYTRQTSMDIRSNSFNFGSSIALELNQATPHVFENNISTSGLSILNCNSYPNLAPVYNADDDSWIWYGGNNTVTSTGNGNINYEKGNVRLDWGQNCFTKIEGYYHLFGQIDERSQLYFVRNNGFNGSNSPDADLIEISSGAAINPYYYGSSFTCSISTDGGTVWRIRDLGNGLYDTLYQTNYNAGEQPPQEEILYSAAVLKMENDEYSNAIYVFKSLINGFPNSTHSENSLYNLYKCYQSLDTGNNNGYTIALYSELLNFLSDRILSNLYSEEFNNTAYNIMMMCYTSIENYSEAMEGYEFISLYHPDEHTRILASWDYSEVQAFVNGSGGISGKEENLTEEQYFNLLSKRVNRNVKEDPIKRVVKKSFNKAKNDKISRTEKDVFKMTNDINLAKKEVERIKMDENRINNRVTSVLRYSNIITQEEREKRKLEDLLSLNISGQQTSHISVTTLPDNYQLSQNYPNPFNPVTKINFALPKQGFVSLKIYDITGREIKILVNEVKQAGYYTVDFNGSHLSSGVYFYRIKSGNFSSVKRMVLIK